MENNGVNLFLCKTIFDLCKDIYICREDINDCKTMVDICKDKYMSSMHKY